MRRKLLSIVLALTMALGMLPAAALAEEGVTEVKDEKELRQALYSAQTGTQVTIKLTANITLEMLYAAENFGTEKLADNAAGDTFNRYKLGIEPSEDDPTHWNKLVTDQTQEQRIVYGAYYHVGKGDHRIARLIVKAGQNIELDLNGCTIQKKESATHGDWSNVCTDIIGNYGTLTITDTSTDKKGTIKGIGYISCQGAVLHNYEGATMTVGAVNVDGNAAGMTKGTGQYVIANDGGTITIDGTNVYDTATSASLLVNTAGTMTVQNNAVLNHPHSKAINAKGTGTITLNSATITANNYAIFATDSSNVTINSGVTINGAGTVKKDKNTATVSNNTGAELPVPAGYEWVTENGSQTLKMNAAVVGGVNYPTLKEAFDALTAEKHTLTLIDGSAWDAATPVYWKAGDRSGYVATLAAALTEAYKKSADSITIVCRPGANVGKVTHGHVADDLTIYGNNAYISDGECDLEVDTFPYSRTDGKQINAESAQPADYLSKDITITAYELDNLGVWGERHTTHTVTVSLTDCDGKAIAGKTNVQRVYISGNTGVNDITLTGCDFLTKATAVYSNADGAVVIDNCSFTDGQVPVNINHKANGAQTVTVKNSKFENCGDEGSWKQFAAPIRFVNSGSGTSTTTVENCEFEGTVGNNGDILIGDGQSGKTSNNLELTVSGTAANVQAQQPGYYDKSGTVADAGKVSKTTVAELETKTIELKSNEAFKLVKVGDTEYSNVTEAMTAAQNGSKAIALLTADDTLVQAILDGQYGSIDGMTIILPTGNYGQLELGRATKYEGSNTEYMVGGFEESAANYQKFDTAEALKTYKEGNGWTPSPYYIRSMSNVTFKAEENATVNIAGVKMSSGHKYGSTENPMYDYVLDSTITDNGGYYLAQKVSGITFDGLNFTAKSDISASIPESTISGFTFKNCTFDINNTADGNQAIRYYNENNNGNVSGLVVENCNFNNCFQGIYTQKIKNITVTGCTFDTTAHNAIAIQSDTEAVDHGAVSITGNTFANIGDRIIRFGNVAEGTKITITNNTATNSGDDKGEVIKASSIAEGVTATIYSNSWGVGTTVVGDLFKDTAAPSSSSGSSRSSVTAPKADHGTVTVTPSRASKGDTVTVTVTPDSGYVLETITVLDKDGKELELTDKGDGKYTFTMPRGEVTVKAAFMEDNSVLNFFYDVPNDAYYYEAVKWAVENGITSGVGNNLFGSNDPCTRAQIVTFLWRAAGSPEPKALSTFADVPANAWYAKAVAWAVENGVTAGVGDGLFGSDDTCTRAQSVTFLFKALKAVAKGEAGFRDVTSSDWFAQAVAWAVENGVTAGVGDNLFGSGDPCSRAQIVTFLFKAYNP